MICKHCKGKVFRLDDNEQSCINCSWSPERQTLHEKATEWHKTHESYERNTKYDTSVGIKYAPRMRFKAKALLDGGKPKRIIFLQPEVRDYRGMLRGGEIAERDSS